MAKDNVVVVESAFEIVEVVTQGPQGIQGIQGDAGVAGSGGIITGSGVPSNSLGTDLNYYIDSNNEDLYRKQSGVWVRITDLDDVDAGFF